jgi:hypothetical protein
LSLGEVPSRASEIELKSFDLIDDEDEVTPVPEFNIGKLKGPSSFLDQSDNEEHDLLDECLKRDIVWSLASAVSVNTNEETTNNVGSWTPFRPLIKKSRQCSMEKHCLSIYLLFQKLLIIKFVSIFLTIYVIF